MNILITGGTGFIGQRLCQVLQTQGHQLWVLTRNIERARQRFPQSPIQFVQHLDSLQSIAFEAVINLAGAPIAQRWSSAYKKVIWQSRIDFTEHLVDFLIHSHYPPQVLVNGSAVGYYGYQRADQPLTEAERSGAGFSSELCAAWEQAAMKAEMANIRVCCLRTGIVLGKNGGILRRMRLPFLCGLGGPIGSGEQWMSWIHLEDIVRVIQFCLSESSIAGPVNATAPYPVANKTFAKTYAYVLKRPAYLPVPALTMQLLYGEMANELLLGGQRVLPAKLQQWQFAFSYPELEKALRAVEN